MSRRTSSAASACASACRWAMRRTTGTSDLWARAGVLAEAVLGLTGLRRDPGAAAKQAQLDGRPCPPPAAWTDRGQVSSRLEYIPQWGDYTLVQSAANAFEIRKRTKPGFGWVGVDQGGRAAGVGYVGGATRGGVVFGLRDFWQRHPTQLDIRGAHTDDGRGHHLAVVARGSRHGSPLLSRRDGHGDLREAVCRRARDHLRGLRAGLGHAPWHRAHERDHALGAGRHALARTADRAGRPCAGPAAARLLPGAHPRGGRLRRAVEPARPLHPGEGRHRGPPRLAVRLLPPPGGAAPLVRLLELRGHHAHLRPGPARVAVRRGRICVDNSELSPDLWLWYAFLRSGRADLFRFAEAMTRHTGEVDVYHLGRFAGLGSRQHDVQHWGCSAKQVRISHRHLPPLLFLPHR